MTASTDPREILNQTAMTRLQVIVVAFTIGLNALDGFDILSISFASRGISSEFGVESTVLGVLLAMELVGMGIGSMLLGGIADKVGRRPTIMGCLLLMTLGMFLVTTAGSIWGIGFWRIVTGIGIGGMLSSINAMVSEFSNNRRRHFSISIMTLGYPIGGVFGGMIAQNLLQTYDWRSVFYFGGSVTLVFIPLFYFLIPESVHWLTRKQPQGALDKINQTFIRMGRAAIDVLPTISLEDKSKTWTEIFNAKLLFITIIISLSYFMHVSTLYFLLKWGPYIVTDFGFAQSDAAGVLVWTSVGGAVGSFVFGLLTLKVDLKWLTIITLVLSFIFVTVFGGTTADLTRISLLAAVAGAFCNAAVVGFYALVAKGYPTHARAFGTGFMLGIGRGGAIVSPILVGFLLSTDLGLQKTAMIIGAGALIAAVMLVFLKLPENPEAET